MKIVQQFAVQFDPPTLFVEYKQGSSIYVRRIRIKQPNDWIHKERGPEALARRIILKFPDLFSSDICYEQLSGVLKIFQRSMKMKPLAAGKSITANSLGDINNIDLNKCSEEMNQRAKKIMDIDFEAKRLKPGDPDFQWDKSTNFNPPTESTDWDIDDD